MPGILDACFFVQIFHVYAIRNSIGGNSKSTVLRHYIWQLLVIMTSENFNFTKWLALVGFCFLRFFVRNFATSSKIGNVVRNLKNSKKNQNAAKLRGGIGGSIRTIIVAVIARKSKNFEFFCSPTNILMKVLTS